MTDDAPALDAAEIQRILEERARALARSADDEAAVKTSALVVLAVGAERLGVNLHQIQEVQPLKGLTPVPGVPAHWAGVVNLRGRLYPVLDLRRYLKLPAATPVEGGQIVVVSAAKLEVALWAGDVLGVRHVAQDAIQPATLEKQGGGRNVISGMTADLLSVLDLDVLLADPALKEQP